MLRFWSRFIVFFLAFGGSGLLLGQTVNEDIRPKENSPISRFGLGNLMSQPLAAPSGMGGLSAAFQDPSHLNLVNPASLAFLQMTAFEVGMYGKYSELKAAGQSTGVWSGNLRYMALGFPLKNSINQALERRQSPTSFGMSFSLQPYSLVGYDVASTDVVEWAGATLNSLKGTGGTYQFSWGNAIRYKNFAGGLNINYLFGKITNNARVELTEVANDYFTEFLDEFSVSGFHWEAGIQQTLHIKEQNDKGELVNSGKRFIFGATFGNKNNFNTNSSKFYHRDNFNFGVQDTILYETEVKGKGTLPSQWRAGLMYEDFNKFRIGLEFQQALWSSYANDAKPETFSDTWRFSLGAEYTPEALSYNKYARRIRYRAGFFYGSDPRSLDGNQITHTGLTLGLGFPIILPRQQISFINLALEGGKFGVKDELNETYVQMILGFTLNDNTWFFKRKYN
jgi:hypothetical protein